MVNKASDYSDSGRAFKILKCSLCVQLALCSERNHVAPEFDELSRLALVMGSVMSAERSTVTEKNGGECIR